MVAAIGASPSIGGGFIVGETSFHAMEGEGGQGAKGTQGHRSTGLLATLTAVGAVVGAVVEH